MKIWITELNLEKLRQIIQILHNNNLIIIQIQFLEQAKAAKILNSTDFIVMQPQFDQFWYFFHIFQLLYVIARQLKKLQIY